MTDLDKLVKAFKESGIPEVDRMLQDLADLYESRPEDIQRMAQVYKVEGLLYSCLLIARWRIGTRWGSYYKQLMGRRL